MNPIKKKVLILCPHPERKGGVAYYYRVLKKHFLSDDITVSYFLTGKRSDKPFFLSRILYTIRDFLFLLKCLPEYDLIHLNPSLDMKSIIRDGFYHFIAKRIYKKKTIVFFRGWSPQLDNIITKKFYLFFKLVFNCDCILVLANSFKSKLASWGYDPDIIFVETTTVDDALLNNFSLQHRLSRIESRHDIQLLFLSRIEKNKGIIETIEAFNLLLKDYPNMRLVIAGIGSFDNNARKLAEKTSNNNISFLGYIRGSEKTNVYLESDIFIFPTYYSEGMPNSILEAMAMGLPVITRPVAGLKDFIKDRENGFIIESKHPRDIALCVNRIINDIHLWKYISSCAHEYAVNNFLSPKVALRLEEKYKSILFSV